MYYVFLGGIKYEFLELIQAVVDSFPPTSLDHWLLDLVTRQQSQIHPLSQRLVQDFHIPPLHCTHCILLLLFNVFNFCTSAFIYRFISIAAWTIKY